MPAHHNIKAPRYACNKCSRRFFKPCGLTKHRNTFHCTDAHPRGVGRSHRIEKHPLLNGESTTQAAWVPFAHETVARPCDEEGDFLPEGASPGHTESRVPGDWSPFNSQDEFELADLLFTRTEMSRGQVDELMQIWAARTTFDGGTAPFTDSKNLYDTIDAIEEGDAPWYSFRVGYNGDRPQGQAPSWMDDSHQVFYRDPQQVVRMFLSNRKFDGNFDYVPYREYENNERKWGDFMSGNFCWKQAVRPIVFPPPPCASLPVGHNFEG